MHKFALVIIWCLYITPILFVWNSELFLEGLQILVIFSGYLLGSSLVILAKRGRTPVIPVDYSDYLIPQTKWLFIVAFLYFLAKLENIVDVFLHLLVYRDYAVWALSNAIERYEFNSDPGVLFKIATSLFICYSFLLGCFNFSKKSIWLYVIFLCMLVIETSALARAGVLLGIAAYFSEFLIRNNKYFEELSLTKYLKLGVPIIIGLIAIFSFSAYFRVSGHDNVGQILLEKAQVYTIAMYNALLLWMKDPSEYASTRGFNSFAAVYKAFGYKASQGFYLPIETNFGVTNIYTNTRGLLSDFGLLMTFIIFGGFGLVISYSSYKKMKLVSYFLTKNILYFIIFILISPFTFSTVMIGSILSYILTILTARR